MTRQVKCLVHRARLRAARSTAQASAHERPIHVPTCITPLSGAAPRVLRCTHLIKTFWEAAATCPGSFDPGSPAYAPSCIRCLQRPSRAAVHACLWTRPDVAFRHHGAADRPPRTILRATVRCVWHRVDVLSCGRVWARSFACHASGQCSRCECRQCPGGGCLCVRSRYFPQYGLF